MKCFKSLTFIFIRRELLLPFMNHSLYFFEKSTWTFSQYLQNPFRYLLIWVCRKLSTPYCFLHLVVVDAVSVFQPLAFFISCRTSTLSKWSLSSLAWFSLESSPFLGISVLGGESFSTLLGSAERNSVGKFSFTVIVVKDCSNQILNCQGGSYFDDTHNTCISIFKRLSST